MEVEKNDTLTQAWSSYSDKYQEELKLHQSDILNWLLQIKDRDEYGSFLFDSVMHQSHFSEWTEQCIGKEGLSDEEKIKMFIAESADIRDFWEKEIDGKTENYEKITSFYAKLVGKCISTFERSHRSLYRDYTQNSDDFEYVDENMSEEMREKMVSYFESQGYNKRLPYYGKSFDEFMQDPNFDENFESLYNLLDKSQFYLTSENKNTLKDFLQFTYGKYKECELEKGKNSSSYGFFNFFKQYVKSTGEVQKDAYSMANLYTTLLDPKSLDAKSELMEIINDIRSAISTSDVDYGNNPKGKQSAMQYRRAPLKANVHNPLFTSAKIAKPRDIPERMGELEKKYQEIKELDGRSYTDGIVDILQEFILIHPFDDFNGRTSRILFNSLLVKKGLTPIDIKKSEFIPLSNQAYGGDDTPLKDWFSSNITQAYDSALANLSVESDELPRNVNMTDLIVNYSSVPAIARKDIMGQLKDMIYENEKGSDNSNETDKENPDVDDGR